MQISLSVRILAAATLLAGTTTSANAAIRIAPNAFNPQDVGRVIAFKGRHIVVGSASDKLDAIKRMHPNNVFPTRAVYVADSMMGATGAIVIFNENASGTQSPSNYLMGGNTQLSGPFAVTTGYDTPCLTNSTPSAATCTNYLWVANAGNDTITAYSNTNQFFSPGPGNPPLWSQTQAPVAAFSTAGCTNDHLTFPGGISHIAPTQWNSPGYVVVSDEGSNSLELFPSHPLPLNSIVCPTSVDFDARFNSPSGVTIRGALPTPTLYNANSDTVTSESYSDSPPGAGSWLPGATWAVGSPPSGFQGPATEGVAFDPTRPMGGYLWVTTNADPNRPGFNFDAVWLCTVNQFPNSCSATPAITAGLSYPAYPRASTIYHRVFVPNATNGTVTAYNEAPPHLLHTTYNGLSVPTGIALTDQY